MYQLSLHDVSTIVVMAQQKMAVSASRPQVSIVRYFFIILIVYIVRTILFQLIEWQSPYRLHDSRSLHLLLQLLVFVDEFLQMCIVVADAPSLVNNDNHQCQHYYDDSGGEGYGEDKSYIHI